MRTVIPLAATAILIISLTVYLSTKENGIEEMPPPYDNPSDIVVGGVRMSPHEYVNEFCRGRNEKYRGSPYCERATTEIVLRSSGSQNPNNPFHGATLK